MSFRPFAGISEAASGEWTPPLEPPAEIGEERPTR